MIDSSGSIPVNHRAEQPVTPWACAATARREEGGGGGKRVPPFPGGSQIPFLAQEYYGRLLLVLFPSSSSRLPWNQLPPA